MPITASIRIDYTREYLHTWEDIFLKMHEKVCRDNDQGFSTLSTWKLPMRRICIMANGDEWSKMMQRMLGGIDYMHQRLKNYPTSCHGRYTGHFRDPTVIIDSVVSENLWFWHCFLLGCQVLSMIPMFWKDLIFFASLAIVDAVVCIS